MRRLNQVVCMLVVVIMVMVSTLGQTATVMADDAALPDDAIATPVTTDGVQNEGPVIQKQVATPAIALDISSGTAGSSVVVTGSGFLPLESVTVTVGADPTVLATTGADEFGGFSVPVTVPPTATVGVVEVSATGTLGSVAIATFEVIPTPQPAVLTLGAPSGSVGSTVSVSGSHFSASETVTITFGGLLLPTASIVTTPEGSFSAAIVVPAWAEMQTYDIVASGALGDSATAAFSVTGYGAVTVGVNPLSGKAGSWATVSGSGFRPNEVVTVYWSTVGGAMLATTSADGDGNISTTIAIPSTADMQVYAVYAVGDSGQAGSTAFDVTAWATAAVTLSSGSGRAGSVSTVNGTGYRPTETVTIRWNSSTGTVLTTVVAGSDGTFSTTVTVPAIANIGNARIYAIGASGQTASAAYAVTAWAVARISLSSTSGQTGSTTIVVGSGYRPSESVTIRWSSSSGPILRTFNASASGTFSATVTIPVSAEKRAYTITAIGASGQKASSTYTVTSWAPAKASLSSTSGRAGTATTVTGTGFRPNETVNVRWSSATGTVLATAKSDATGKVAVKVTVPVLADKKAYPIHMVGSSGQSASATYTVNAWSVPTAKLSSSTGRAGSKITITGTNYRPNEFVKIRWSSPTGTQLANMRADANGKISVTVVVPTIADKKAYKVYAVGASGQTASATYTVNAYATVTLSLNVVQKPAGTKITIAGRNFLPGKMVTIRWGTSTGVILGTATPNTSGQFSKTVTIPASAPVGTGRYTATSASGQSGTGTFRVLAPWTAPSSTKTDIYNCSDFASQAEAQEYLQMYPGDPSRLDRDHNGIACESNS